MYRVSGLGFRKLGLGLLYNEGPSFPYSKYSCRTLVLFPLAAVSIAGGEGWGVLCSFDLVVAPITPKKVLNRVSSRKGLEFERWSTPFCWCSTLLVAKEPLENKE